MSAGCARLLPGLAIVVAAHAMTAGAQRPGAPEVIPVFPGAVSYEADKRQVVRSIHETLLGLSDGIPLLSSTQQDWYAQATSDKVDAFYRARLGGIASGFAQWNAIDPRSLAPGRATDVHHQRYQASGEMLYVYHWFRKETGGEIVLHELRFANTIIAFAGMPRTGPLTLITATTKTYSEKAVSVAPDEQALGVPVFPGARYDANASTNTLGALFAHVFLSSDAPASVIAFYERFCGNKALEGAPPGGGVTWVFRPCTQAHPDDFILIEAADNVASHGTRIIYNLMRVGPPSRH